MRKLLAINSISGVLQLLVNAGLIFFTIPIFITIMGMEKYGVFSLLLLIGNLNSFVNLGLNSALIKFLSEQGKCIQSNYDIIISFIILLLVLIPLTLLAIMFYPFILLNILNIPDKYFVYDVIVFFKTLMIANFFVLLSQISSAILDAQQKIYLTNLFQVIYNFLYWLLILIALKLFKSFEAIGFSILLSALIWFVCVTYSALHFWGKITFKGLFQEFYNSVKKQLSYGLKIYLSGTLLFFFEPVSKIILSKLMGVNEVGIFDIALKARMVIWNLFSKLLYPVYPLIARLQDKMQIRLLVHDLEQKIVYLLVPAAVSTFFVSNSLAQLWIGRSVSQLAISFNYIILANLMALVLFPNYQYLTAKDHAGKTILLQGSNVVFNAFIIAVTFNFMGFYSFVAGHFAALLSGFVMGLYYQKKYLNSLIFDNCKQIFNLLSFVVLIVIAGFILNYLIKNPYLHIILIPILLYVLVIPLFRLLKIITLEDISRYIGKNNILSDFLSKLLVAQNAK